MPFRQTDRQNMPFLTSLAKCFRAGCGACLTFKYRVKGGTKLCQLFVILKLDLLDIYRRGCGPFCVALLTDGY